MYLGMFFKTLIKPDYSQKSCVDQGGVLRGVLMTASGSRNFPNATVFGSGQKLCQNWLRGSLLPTSCALSTVPAMDEKVKFWQRRIK